MRVAFAGTHRTGKTTLVEAVAARLPGYEVVDEPYRVLEDEGYETADPPSVEDFERQLRVSLDALAAPRADVLFDRSPLDFVAYLQAIDEDVDVDDWMDELREATAALDLVVVVPIEAPDRIAVPDHEDRRLRRRVDTLVRALLLEDRYGLELATVEVTGGVDARVRQVLAAMDALAGR